MLRFIIILAFLPAFVLAQPQQLQLVSSDTIDCAVQNTTLRLDSITNRVTGTKTYDSTGYNDWRFPGNGNSRQLSPVQLEIHVRINLGRADTLVLKQYESGVWLDSIGYDTVAVPVPVMDLATAGMDTLMIVSGGPIASFKQGSYRYGKFLVYSSAMENHVWVLERRRATPVVGDTHKIIIDIYRRMNYSGGQ